MYLHEMKLTPITSQVIKTNRLLRTETYGKYQYVSYQWPEKLSLSTKGKRYRDSQPVISIGAGGDRETQTDREMKRQRQRQRGRERETERDLGIHGFNSDIPIKSVLYVLSYWRTLIY